MLNRLKGGRILRGTLGGISTKKQVGHELNSTNRLGSQDIVEFYNRLDLRNSFYKRLGTPQKPLQPVLNEDVPTRKVNFYSSFATLKTGTYLLKTTIISSR